MRLVVTGMTAAKIASELLTFGSEPSVFSSKLLISGNELPTLESR